jgi:hypothetical protein
LKQYLLHQHLQHQLIHYYLQPMNRRHRQIHNLVLLHLHHLHYLDQKYQTLLILMD